jgi:hypothetical protein
MKCLFFKLFEEKRGLEESNVVRRLLEWSKRSVTRVTWGRGAVDGSFSVVLDYGPEYPLIPFIFHTYGNGKVEIPFRRMMMKHPPFDAEEKRLELLRRLNMISEVFLPEDGITRRPSIPLRPLVDPTALEHFLQVMEWTIEEVKAAHKRTRA